MSLRYSTTGTVGQPMAGRNIKYTSLGWEPLTYTLLCLGPKYPWGSWLSHKSNLVRVSMQIYIYVYICNYFYIILYIHAYMPRAPSPLISSILTGVLALETRVFSGTYKEGKFYCILAPIQNAAQRECELRGRV